MNYFAKTPFKIFEEIHLYCFDLEQYNPLAKTLAFTIFANYKGLSFFSNDIYTDTRGNCIWIKDRWYMSFGAHQTKIRGLKEIAAHLDEIEEGKNKEEIRIEFD